MLPTALPPPVLNEHDESKDTMSATTHCVLYRDGNGWCLYSERLWLALEYKQANYQTVLCHVEGDTYDGSSSGGSNALPQILPRLVVVQGKTITTASDTITSENDPPEIERDWSNTSSTDNSADAASIAWLRQLDTLFPDSPRRIWPLKDSPYIAEQIEAYHKAIRPLAMAARPSPRAALLFHKTEGYRLDPLESAVFQTFLETTESILQQRHEEGPFFCGASFSAADIVWAPLLERYAIQLPCLLGTAAGVIPRDSTLYPHLCRWYDAMETIPEYVCRIRGDALSWRKVLYRDPWWPSADTWHSRDTVGPKGALQLDEPECEQVFHGNNNSNNHSLQDWNTIWSFYGQPRPHVSPLGPAAEAACCILRNRKRIIQDARQWMEDEGYQNGEEDVMKEALKNIVVLLYNRNLPPPIDKSNDDNDAIDINKRECITSTTAATWLSDPMVHQLLLYLDHRVCVPRDMGAPSAAAIRTLLRDSMNVII